MINNIIDCIHVNFPDIDWKSEYDVLIEDNYSQISKTPTYHLLIQSKPIQQKAGIILCFLHFDNISNIFQIVDIKKIIHIFFNPFSVDRFESLVTILFGLYKDLSKNKNSLKIRSSEAGLNSFLFKDLRKILQSKHFDFFFFNLRKIWISYLYLLQKIGSANPNFAFDILHSLIFMSVSSESSAKISLKLDDFIFFQLKGYTLTSTIFKECQNLIFKFVPDFSHSFFNFEEYRVLYLKELNSDQFDFSMFSEGENECVKVSLFKMNCEGSFLDNETSKSVKTMSKLGNLTFTSKIDQEVSIQSRSENSLFSFKMNKNNQEINRTQKIKSIFEWYKERLLEFRLNEIDFDPFSKIPVSKLIFDELTSSTIVNNLLKCWKLSFDIFDTENREQFYCFFTSILTTFSKSLPVSEKLHNPDHCLLNLRLMKGILCLCSYFYCFINQELQKPFSELFETIGICWFDFWKSLNIFIFKFGKNLPIALKCSAFELETDILLVHIWRKPENENPMIFNLFQNAVLSQNLILQRLLKISAERLFILGKKMKMSDFEINNCWGLLKKLMQAGYEFNYSQIQTSYKENIHLDILILCCLDYCLKLTMPEFNQSNMIDLYLKNIIFAAKSVAVNFEQYNNTFISNKIIQMCQTSLSDSSDHSDDQHFQAKKIQSDFLFANIDQYVPVISAQNSYQIGEFKSLKKRAELYSPIDANQMSRKKIKEFSIGSSQETFLSNSIRESDIDKNIQIYKTFLRSACPSKQSFNLNNSEEAATRNNSKIEY